MFVDKSARELLYLYDDVLQELRRRKIVRSGTNPVGELARYLATRALELKVSRDSPMEPEFLDADGERYQIRGRRVTRTSQSASFSLGHELEDASFTHLIGIVFTEDFEILRAGVVPMKIVRNKAILKKGLRGGWRFELNDEVLEQGEVKNITQEVRAVVDRL
ncbi:MAG: hypothetical protein WAN10_02400 [Candidatus Acidiferrales bacterium]